MSAVMDRFRHFFQDKEEVEYEAHVERCREVLDWTGQAYHKQFLSWLDEQAGKPYEVSENHMAMVQAAVRANTLREVRQYLSRLERGASDAVQQLREDMNA